MKNTTESKVTNFRRFYAALKEIQYTGDREELKKEIVEQYTWGRTCHLHEMTREEYENCCAALEKLSGLKEKVRKARSLCLKLMQKLGIDTTDWSRVDEFCTDARIGGKAFRLLRLEELEALQVKLRSIQRKGGLRKADGNHGSDGKHVVLLGLGTVGEA